MSDYPHIPTMKAPELPAHVQALVDEYVAQIRADTGLDQVFADLVDQSLATSDPLAIRVYAEQGTLKAEGPFPIWGKVG